MEIAFIAGFGPIPRESDASLALWRDALGLPLEQLAPGYFHTHDVEGARAFALWPLSQAAEATFGTAEWPAGRPVPQAWIEFEMSSPEAVAAGMAELGERGYEVLVDAHEEPWGQTTGRMQSPEGLLTGLSYLPSYH